MICLRKKRIALSQQITYGLFKRKIVFSLIFTIYFNCPFLIVITFLNIYYVFCIIKLLYFFCFTEHLYCSKCNVYVDNLDADNTYMHRLYRVCVTIGTGQKFTKSRCQSSDKKPVSMHIECSSWNKSNLYENVYTLICDSLNVNFKFWKNRCIKHTTLW